jgi:hypothetical protein
MNNRVLRALFADRSAWELVELGAAPVAAEGRRAMAVPAE